MESEGQNAINETLVANDSGIISQGSAIGTTAQTVSTKSIIAVPQPVAELSTVEDNPRATEVLRTETTDSASFAQAYPSLFEKWNAMRPAVYAEGRSMRNAETSAANQIAAVNSLYLESVITQEFDGPVPASAQTIIERTLEPTHVCRFYTDPVTGQNLDQAYYGTPSPAAGNQVGTSGWMISTAPNLDDKVIAMTTVQVQRVSEYETNHKDTTTIWRADNAGMSGSQMMIYNQIMMQNVSGVARFSTQMPWLKFWLYCRMHYDVPAMGHHLDGCYLTNLNTGLSQLKWPILNSPQHTWPFVGRTFATEPHSKPDVWAFSVFVTFRVYVEWLVGLTNINDPVDPTVRLTPSQIGNAIYIIPISDIAMSAEELIIYTLAHMPYPFCADNGDLAAGHGVFNMTSVPGQPIFNRDIVLRKNAERVYTTDTAYSEAGFAPHYCVMYVYQPISGMTGVDMFGMPLTNAAPFAWSDLRVFMINNWATCWRGLSGAHNILSRHYGQGSTYQDMYELSIALTYTISAPKFMCPGAYGQAGNASFSGMPTYTGNNVVPQGSTAPDNQWWIGLPTWVSRVNPNLLLSQMQFTGGYPLQKQSACIFLNPMDMWFNVGLAFNFFRWSSPGMDQQIDIPIDDYVLPHRIAKWLAVGAQLAVGEVPFGTLNMVARSLNEVTNNMRDNIVIGRGMCVRDGSLRSRLEAIFNFRVGLGMPMANLAVDWFNMFEDPYSANNYAWHRDTIWFFAPIWDWVRYIGADIVCRNSLQEWLVHIKDWEKERRIIAGKSVAILKKLPRHWQSSWGSTFSDLWYRGIFNPDAIWRDPLYAHTSSRNVADTIFAVQQVFPRWHARARRDFLALCATMNFQLLAGETEYYPVSIPFVPIAGYWYSQAEVEYFFDSSDFDVIKLGRYASRVLKGIVSHKQAINIAELSVNHFLA
jgi:hypothetical protein